MITQHSHSSLRGISTSFHRFNILRFCIPLLFTILTVACSYSQIAKNGSANEHFALLAAPEEEILNAAYETLYELFPNSLIMPLMGDVMGYQVDVEYFDWDNPFQDYFSPPFQTAAFSPHLFLPFSRSYLVRLEFSEMLGKTSAGSIITGYKYRITTIPKSFNLYVDEGVEEIDLVFRSELVKQDIPRVMVSRAI